MRGEQKGNSGDPSPSRKSEMIVKLPADRRPKRSERRTVYVRYGMPAVTAVEIEIMRLHLASTGSGLVAHNDNC
jgi:hypothetical protein